MKHFVVDGAVIEYEAFGPGKPVLLIHVSLIPNGLTRPLLAEPEHSSTCNIDSGVQICYSR